MIWHHGLLLLLLAWATVIELRTRHIPNEVILTGLCLSTIWSRIQPSGSKMIWSTGALSGLTPILRVFLPYALVVGGLWCLAVALRHLPVRSNLRIRALRRDPPRRMTTPLQARATLETLPYAVAIGVGSAIALLEHWA